MIKEYFEQREDKLAIRDFTLMFFGLYTGFRIAEILSIRVDDVYKNGKIQDTVYLKKSNTKGKKEGRVAILNDRCKEILETYILEYRMDEKAEIYEGYHLFPSSHDPSKPLTTRRAGYILARVYRDNGLEGKLATHTLRKTFAHKAYEAVDHNILDVQQMLGHKSLDSTSCYLSANSEKISSTLKGMKF